MGLLLLLSLGASVTATFVLLPALLALDRSRKAKHDPLGA